jgi:hypothetical protein
VLAAYWLARQLPWVPLGVLAGLLASLAVLAVPAMLVRDDLKQYTADACLSLLVLALAAHLEAGWPRWRLAALSAAVWGGLLFSVAVAFTGVAALAAVNLVQLGRRPWARLAEAVAAAAVTGILVGGIYEAFYAKANGPGIVAYWKAFYVPVHHGGHASLTFLGHQLEGIRPYFGLGPYCLAVPMFRVREPGAGVSCTPSESGLLTLRSWNTKPRSTQ